MHLKQYNKKGGDTFMALAKKDGPKYTKKVEKVLEKLGNGKSRKELAQDYDYSTWKSLDVYMRRKGFRYDSERGNYVPDVKEEAEDPVPKGAGSRASLIISLFAEGKDPRQIAKKVGFSDHRKLSSYMVSRGYAWSSEEENYVKEDEVDDSEEVNDEKENEQNSLPVAPAEILQYLPLLEKLSEKEEVLEQILSAKADSGKVPRYAVPGDSMTKSTYMSRRLAQLVDQFSEQRNVSQRAIVEGALVEFFKKYGFKEEMDALLQRK